MTITIGGSGFKISEVSRALGVAPQTLRLWETERLVLPRRSDRGYRVYTEDDVQRLREVKRLREVEGLNFPAIRQQLGAPQRPTGEADGAQSTGHNPVGEVLRRLRIKSNRTLREVAEATGLSISFISAVERGESGASVASLRLLAKLYGVSVRHIFGADLREASPLVRRQDRPVMRWDNGIRFEELATGPTIMDPSLLHVPPHTGSEGFYSHAGEEFIYVLRGRLHVELKDQGAYELSPGDTLYFPSSTPHRWWAEEEAVEAVYVNTPPTF